MYLKEILATKSMGAAIMKHKRQGLKLQLNFSSLAVFVIDTQTGQTWRMSRTDTYEFGTPQACKSVRRSQTPLID